MTENHICPHCGQQMLMRFGVKLPPRKAEMFDMLHNAGKRGITLDVLCYIFYPGKSGAVARKAVLVHITQLNEFLEETDLRIVRRGDNYHIINQITQVIAA